MEPHGHGATLYTSNTTGAVWRPFKLSLEMDGAAWRRMEWHRATLSTSNTTLLQEPYGDPLN